MPKVLKKQKTRILKVRVAGHWTLLHFLKHVLGAGSRNRTGTLFPARDFESRASTYSAIPATRDALSLIYRDPASFSLCKRFSAFVKSWRRLQERRPGQAPGTALSVRGEASVSYARRPAGAR